METKELSQEEVARILKEEGADLSKLQDLSADEQHKHTVPIQFVVGQRRIFTYEVTVMREETFVHLFPNRLCALTEADVRAIFVEAVGGRQERVGVETIPNVLPSYAKAKDASMTSWHIRLSYSDPNVLERILQKAFELLDA